MTCVIPRGSLVRLAADILAERGPLSHQALWSSFYFTTDYTQGDVSEAVRELKAMGAVSGNGKRLELTEAGRQALAAPANRAAAIPAPVLARQPIGGHEPISHPIELLTQSPRRSSSAADLAPPVIRPGAMDARALPRLHMGWRIWPDGRKERA